MRGYGYSDAASWGTAQSATRAQGQPIRGDCPHQHAARGYRRGPPGCEDALASPSAASFSRGPVSTGMSLLPMEPTFSQEDALAVEEALDTYPAEVPPDGSPFPWSLLLPFAGSGCRNWRSASTRTRWKRRMPYVPDWPVPAFRWNGGIWRTVRERDGGYVAAALFTTIPLPGGRPRPSNPRLWNAV